MGMFDYILFKTNCPNCGTKVDSFQSKDGPCAMVELNYWEVNNFYSDCPRCDTWIEFSRVVPRPKSPIEDYKMTYRRI